MRYTVKIFALVIFVLTSGMIFKSPKNTLKTSPKDQIMAFHNIFSQNLEKYQLAKSKLM